MRRAPARPVRVCFVRTCCTVVVQEHDLRAAPVQCNAKRTLSSHVTVHASHPTLHTCTSHSTLHLISNHVISSHLISALLTCHLSKFFSTVFISSLSQSPRSSSQLISAVLHARKLLPPERSLLQKRPLGADSFCTQMLETQMHLHRKAFPKHFVLQSLHKALPSTTLYYKACTKYFPILLCTTKLAQSTSQYYFVLRSLRKALPSIYYFELQSLHKVLPSTTLYYKKSTKHSPVLLCTTKACTKHSPVLLCTAKLAPSTPQEYFVL